MVRKPATKPKLTDAERHKRFVEMARKVEASESPKAFDEAFKRVTSRGKVNQAGSGLRAGPLKGR